MTPPASVTEFIDRWSRAASAHVGAGSPRDGLAGKSQRKAATSMPGAKLLLLKSLAERVKAIETTLAAAETPQPRAQLARLFGRAKPTDVEEILQTLATLGHAHQADTPGTYVR